jgi:hypothetical protein
MWHNQNIFLDLLFRGLLEEIFLRPEFFRLSLEICFREEISKVIFEMLLGVDLEIQIGSSYEEDGRAFVCGKKICNFLEGRETYPLYIGSMHMN